MKRLPLAAAAVALIVGVLAVAYSWQGESDEGGSPRQEWSSGSGSVRAVEGAPPSGANPGSLQESRALWGTVLDEAGKPIEGAEIFVALSKAESLAVEACTCGECGRKALECGCHHAGQQVAALIARREGEVIPESATRSDKAGAFRFAELPRGKYTVWAAARGRSAALKRAVELGVELTLVCPKGLELHGHLVDEQKRPIAGAALVALPATLPRFVEAASLADGSYLLAGLAQEPHFLSISAEGFLPAGLPAQQPNGAAVDVTLLRPRVLEGLVKDHGKPAAGAEVRLFAEHFSQILTAADGRFRVEALYPGAYSVAASSGRRAATLQISLDDAVTRVELNLEDALLVKGTVQDESGVAVDGALIVAGLSGKKLGETKSDKGGAFALGGVPPGTRLHASKDGFEPAARRVDREDEVIQFVLTRQSEVTGIVVASDGTPVPGVTVVPIAGGRSKGTSDGDGQFKISLAASGPVTLMAHHSTFGAGEVSVDAPATGVELRLDAKGGFKARVVDEHDKPVPGARVSAIAADVKSMHPETYGSDVPSSEKGDVVLAGLPGSTYRVQFSAPGHPPAERNAVDVPSRGIVDLGDVRLEQGRDISGLVLKADHSPASGVWVHALTGDRAQSEGVQTGRDGAFTISGLREGSYRVTAYSETSVAEQESPAGAKGVVLHLPGPSKVKGRVLGDDHAPITQFSIDGTAFTSSDGRFEAEVRSYKETVFFRVTAPDRVTAFHHAKLGPDHVADAGDILLTKAGSVDGKVVNDRGEPVAGATVTALSEHNGFARDDPDRQAVTGANGTFRLERLAPGPAFLRARRGTLAGEQMVVLPTTSEIVLKLQAKCSIEGMVRNPSGKPLPLPAMVQTDTAGAVTDTTGRFRVENLVPGRHTVRVLVVNGNDPDRLASLNRDVNVNPGETLRLDVTLGTGTLNVQVEGGESGELLVSSLGGAAEGWQFVQSAAIEDGHAVIGGLPGGKYSVRALSTKYRAPATVEISEGGQASLTLDGGRAELSDP